MDIALKSSRMELLFI